MMNEISKQNLIAFLENSFLHALNNHVWFGCCFAVDDDAAIPVAHVFKNVQLVDGVSLKKYLKAKSIINTSKIFLARNIFT